MPLPPTACSDDPPAPSLADRLDELLPQTQCQRCGFTGCRPYAEAMAAGQAAINRCPPGGEETLAALAATTGQPAESIDPACGTVEPYRAVVIDPTQCIGCTKCLAPCPVDAIVGAAKLMHTVIVGHCTGCGLCLPPCPVDCISFLPAREQDQTPVARAARAALGRRNWQRRQAREARRQSDGKGGTAVPRTPTPAADGRGPDDGKSALVLAARERARRIAASHAASSAPAYAGRGDPAPR